MSNKILALAVIGSCMMSLTSAFITVVAVTGDRGTVIVTLPGEPRQSEVVEYTPSNPTIGNMPLVGNLGVPSFELSDA